MHLVLLAPLVLVPLLLDAAVPVSFSERPSRLLEAASWLVLPGALAASAAFLVPRDAAPVLVPAGGLAISITGVLVVPWGIATGLVAAWALRGIVQRARSARLDAPEAVLSAGLTMLPGGAVWLFVERSGIDPGAYGALVALLTAAHVHYAAFAVPVWSGLLGRALSREAPGLRRASALLGGGVVVGFWLVAVGIGQGRGPLGGSPVETVGVLVLTLSAVGVGVLGLVVAPRLGDRWSGAMVAVSGGALALAMALAFWFHLGPRFRVDSPDIAWMLQRHGWLNAVGFGLWGALGWRRLRPRPATP